MKLNVGTVADKMTGKIVSPLTRWRGEMMTPILFIVLGLGICWFG